MDPALLILASQLSQLNGAAAAGNKADQQKLFSPLQSAEDSMSAAGVLSKLNAAAAAAAASAAASASAGGNKTVKAAGTFFPQTGKPEGK